MRRFAAPLAIFALLAALPVLAAFGLKLGFVQLVLLRVMIFAMAAMSLDFLVGVAGLASFGHAAPMAIGAYAVAMLDAADIHSALVVIPTAAFAAAGFGALTGAVALRTRGIQFIMITLAFAQMIFFAAGSLSDYGGDDGTSLDNPTELFGVPLFDRRHLYVTALVCLVLVWLKLRILTASRFGRVLAAIRQDRMRVQAMGFAPFFYELAALAIAGAIAGISGVLLANQAAFVSPAYAAWHRSGALLAMVILGGAGSLHGAILGALLVVGFEEAVGRATEHWALIFGPLLVLSVVFLRHGLTGQGKASRHE